MDGQQLGQQQEGQPDQRTWYASLWEITKKLYGNDFIKQRYKDLGFEELTKMSKMFEHHLKLVNREILSY
ncbi:hypothetical protein C1646_704044, partial [Rhizophagus diaphanus]